MNDYRMREQYREMIEWIINHTYGWRDTVQALQECGFTESDIMRELWEDASERERMDIEQAIELEY